MTMCKEAKNLEIEIKLNISNKPVTDISKLKKTKCPKI